MGFSTAEAPVRRAAILPVNFDPSSPFALKFHAHSLSPSKTDLHHYYSRFIFHRRPQRKMDHSKGLAIAFEEAKLSYSEGGIPVGTSRAVPLYLNLTSNPHLTHPTRDFFFF